MAQMRVLVVGASIAGPTTAYWLAKAGAQVTVIERFPSLRMGGQNIDIRVCGVSVMRKMDGMEAAVRAKILDIEGLSFVRENGRPYGTLRATGDMDQQALISEFEIFRGELSQILYDMTKENENIKYVFGEQVALMRQSEKDNGPITVDFANGLPTAEYDLVVACDGATSRTRAMGLGCGLRDYVHPTNCWAAYFSTGEDLLSGSRTGLGFSAPGRFMSLGPDQANTNRIAFIRVHPKNDRDAIPQFREASKKGDQALRGFVAQQYQGSGWRTNEFLEAMRSAPDFYASEIVQVKLPSLSKGRFVLVGDAGYAPGLTGAGTTLALAGAYILSGELKKAKGDIAAGLKGYEEQMRPLITDMQKQPPIGPVVLAPQTWWGIWIRNWIFAFVTWSGIVNFAQRYLAPAFASTDKYPLPEYEWET